MSDTEWNSWNLIERMQSCKSTDKDIDEIGPQALQLLIRFGQFKAGAHRVVFLDDDFVYKLAVCTEGEHVNEVEVRGAVDAPVASCSWDEVDGIRVVKMERVEVVDARELSDDELRRAPWWVDVDCWKLGRRTNGDLVCFDAGQFGSFNRNLLPDDLQERYHRLCAGGDESRG